MNDNQLLDFITESNAIEGINTAISLDQFSKVKAFLNLPSVRLEDIYNIVNIFQPDAKLRELPGMDVEVGDYVAPKGGFDIKIQLGDVLEMTNYNVLSPFANHRTYQIIHPFMDCNGRSGRLLWLWQIINYNHEYAGSFLQTFYYQALK